MFSNPKPKRSSKGKTLQSQSSILSSLNRNKRKQFSERANLMSENILKQHKQHIAKSIHAVKN